MAPLIYGILELFGPVDPLSLNIFAFQFPSELVQKLDGKKGYSENTLGLLRFIRNLLEH